jgi:tetratricopeptide (TPR) repeat protein
MIKLKEIIVQLDDNTYEDFKQQLSKNKADNFLYLAQSYRKNNVNDEEIINHLNLNSNSFYVLKSRLYDKIKSHISSGVDVNREDILRQLQQVHEMVYNQPRELAIAFLQKLEEDLLKFDMHSELLMVYSALKKVHVKSDRYFHYSQLYNKHLAFWLSLEKTEVTLGNFNQLLGLYDCSKSSEYTDKLSFLHKEVLNHLALNPSRQIEIIKNIVELQLFIFCDQKVSDTFDAEEVLDDTAKKLKELPESSTHKKWEVVVDYLYFEYFKKINSPKATNLCLKVNEQIGNFMLFNSICLSPRFLISKAQVLCDAGKQEELLNDLDKQILIDPNDSYSKVLYGLYSSLLSYYSGRTKEAINTLNSIINLYSFKDFFHINIEIKITLAYYYIQIKEFDLAENLLKNIYRKIKSEELTQYDNVLDIIKVLNMELYPDKTEKGNAKKKDSYTLFVARNNGKYAVLNHLMPEFKKKFNLGL